MDRAMDMAGKIVLITGGSSGIGKVTALELAKRGARVVIGARPSAKADSALEEIRRASSVERVTLLPLDLASFESIRKAASDFLASHDRLHVLINNAGLFPKKLQFTVEGFESQIGVNHLGHFLLTALLRDRLIASAPARVIHLSSMFHARGNIDFESFRGEKPYKQYQAYSQSKLANLLFSNELARRLGGTGVTSNAVHPGGVRTDIMRDEPAVMRWLIGLFFASPEKGALTSIRLATADDLAETTGGYFAACSPAKPKGFGSDVELAGKLWDRSVELCGPEAAAR